MTITSGGDVLLHYKWEDDGFRNEPTDDTYKTYGAEPRLQTADGSNNAVELFGPNSKTPTHIVEQLFDGTWAVRFVYSNPWWLRGAFGTPNTNDNGDGSYTHTYTTSGKPTPMRIYETYTGANKDRVLEGCIINDITFDWSLGENAVVTVRGAYGYEDTRDPAELESQTRPEYDPLNFRHAEVQSSGDVVSDVIQSSELTVSPNITLVNGLGSRFPVDYSDKEVTTRLNVTKLKEADIDHLKEMYGGDTSTQQSVDNTKTMNAIIDNGADAENINKLDGEVTATFPESYSEQSPTDPTQDVEETFERWGQDVMFEATNTTETPI